MIKKAYRKFRADFQKLPERKQYIEFFTAVLTVPVLLTVIILNINNLKATNKKDEPKSEPTVREIVITQPTDKEAKTVTITTEPCKPGVGTVAISYPEEGDTVSDNPVQFGIKYTPGKYCAVVWSYRINSGRWSDYDDKSVALYNLPSGNVTFDLRVKSVVSGEEKSVSRSFTYSGTSQTTPTASSSAQ